MRFYGEQSTYFPTLSVVVNDLSEGAGAAQAGDLFNWRAFACRDCIDAAQVTNAKLQLVKTFYFSLGGEGAGQDQRCAAAALGQRWNEHMLDVGGARLEV